MRHIIRNSVLAIVVLLICVSSIFPPEANLRRGRDLAGGVSLVYSVHLEAEDDPGRTIDAMIEVLKNRVDPNGLYEIAFVRQGRNRIEISMPLPTPEVLNLRQRYVELLTSLDEDNIDADALDSVIRSPASERAALIVDLARRSRVDASTIERVATLHDEAQAARQAYDQAAQESPSEEELDRLATAAGDALLAYQRARNAALATSVPTQALERALELPSDPRRIVDTSGSERVVEALPSQRAEAIERIRAGHPDALERIDEIVAAHGVYVAKRRGLDDANDLKRLLRGAGVLNFRIAVQPQEHPEERRLRADLDEKGPRAAQAPDARWFEIHDIQSWYDTKQELEWLQIDPASYFAQRFKLVGAEHHGAHYVLLYDAPGLALTEAQGRWAVSRAYETPDELGRPAIGFQMNPLGASLLGQLTGANLGKPMAVLLDNKVYTAPNLNGRITSRGIIMGNFPPDEIKYITRTLGAGSLQARLSETPESEDVMGPQLGADNLRRGMKAGMISFVLVAGFMLVYYMGAGVVSVIALLCNAIIILGLMSLSRAAFTMPGIAGVVLTFGMAVDANVLIYERIREEIEAGADLRTAVRLGFEKVLSTIMDANITTLIACFVLFYTATQELRGFAITMGIGIVGTLFSALLVTRLIFTALVDHIQIRRMPQLPTLVPAIQRVITPRIDWLRLRPVFWTMSAIFIGVSLFAVFTQGRAMLGNEFVGGTSVTVRLSEDADGPEGPSPSQPIYRTRAEVEARIKDVAAAAPADSATAKLATAEILPVNPRGDGVTSDQFKVRTTATDQVEIYESVTTALSEWIEVNPPLTFDGAGAAAVAEAPVYRVVESTLGANLGRPELLDDVEDYVGGVAILLENIQPPPTREALERRFAHMRQQQDFAPIADRTVLVRTIDGSDERVRSAIVVSVDPAVSIFDEEARWRTEVASPEWTLVSEAMAAPPSLASVQTFSPQIAETFKAQATVAVVLTLGAIMMYIWIRFGSVRYSAAAVLSLAHDVCITLGFVALSQVLYRASPELAGKLLIEPFKIDLPLIAALLTIVGYSLNDTIVIMDRVRENRGKLAVATKDVINKSINQTFSRTIITTGTTLLAVLILYVVGGAGVRPFAFAILIGVGTGVYSTVAVAAPLLYAAATRPLSGEALRRERDDAAKALTPA